MYTRQYGGSWIPLFRFVSILDENKTILLYVIFLYHFASWSLNSVENMLQSSANKEKKSDESYWVVGLNASNLFAVVCKSPDSFPQVGYTAL